MGTHDRLQIFTIRRNGQTGEQSERYARGDLEARAIREIFLEAEGQKLGPTGGESKQAELEAEELKLMEDLLPLPFLSRTAWSPSSPPQNGMVRRWVISRDCWGCSVPVRCQAESAPVWAQGQARLPHSQSRLIS